MKAAEFPPRAEILRPSGQSIGLLRSCERVCQRRSESKGQFQNWLWETKGRERLVKEQSHTSGAGSTQLVGGPHYLRGFYTPMSPFSLLPADLTPPSGEVLCLTGHRPQHSAFQCARRLALPLPGSLPVRPTHPGWLWPLEL